MVIFIHCGINMIMVGVYGGKYVEYSLAHRIHEEVDQK